MKLTKKIQESTGEVMEVLDLTKAAHYLTKEIEKLVIKYKYAEKVKVERSFVHDAVYVTLFFVGDNNTTFFIFEWHKDYLSEVLQNIEDVFSGKKSYKDYAL